MIQTFKRTTDYICKRVITMLKTTLWTLLFFTVFISQAQSADQKEASSYFNLDSDGLALQGYDPVSYHNQGPEKGKKEYSFEYDGVTYQFSSRENLETFKASPDAYLPAFGGWCAWAMLDGEKVEVDAETYKIINGTSYLFYNSFFTNTLPKWNSRAKNESEEALVKKARSEWRILESAP